MFRSYLKIGLRNLIKGKFYTAVNIVGLSVALAIGLMILIWVQGELTFDSFHANAANIYRINSHIGDGRYAQVWEGSPAPLAVFCRQSIPGIVGAVRINRRYEQLIFMNVDKKFVESNTAYVDPEFFTMFSFHLLRGDQARPFRDDHSIVITATLAKKYFNTDKAIGKILISDNNNYVITGVLKNFLPNSSINYDILFPMSLYAKDFQGNGIWKTIDEDLGNYNFNTFLQLKPGVSPRNVADQITKIYRDNRKGDQSTKNTFFALQSLKSLHLVTADGNTSVLQTIKIFIVIAILILIIGCINYINLTTARSMTRSKDIAIRKIIGASKFNLLHQYIIESSIVFIVSSIIAFGIIYLLLPLYNSIVGKRIELDLNNLQLWRVIITVIIGTLILGSFYPALILASLKPLNILKGILPFGIGNFFSRKFLMVIQFVFSITLIIASIVIAMQMHYIRNKDLGYNKDQIFYIQFTTEKLHNYYGVIRNELLKEPSVSGIAGSDNNIIGMDNTTGDTHWEGKQIGSTFLIHPNGVDENFIPLLKLHLVQGRNFDGSPTDSTHFILNETAVKQAEIKEPIGKKFVLWDIEGVIIGVVKDFNYGSLKQVIEPAIFYFDPPNWTMYVKATGNNIPHAIAATKRIWDKYSHDFPFQYAFLDDTYNKLYQSEERDAKLIEVFAAIAILISCLGLFALITFTTEIKTREIAIRKILGADMLNVTWLLVKEFLFLVLIALFIAFPIGWYIMNKWLQDFAYRTDISSWVFGLAGTIIIVLTLTTVGFGSVKAVLANPAKSLKAE